MSVKIARMRSGEDVIADVKEVRASEDHTLPLAYQFTQPYSVVIEQPADKMFDFQGEETVPDEMDLSDVQIKLYPWVSTDHWQQHRICNVGCESR